MTQTVDRRPTWDEVVDEHSGRVYRLAYRLSGNQADAEDLTQDVFVRTFGSLDSFSADTGSGSIEGWLHRVTTNLFLDRMRRRARIRFDLVADLADGRLGSSTPAPDGQVLGRTLDADVEQALAALSPDYRAAVVLCDIEEMSSEEAGRLLGVKPGTVRSRLHRGRTQLRRALAHREPASGRVRYAGHDG